MRRFARTAGMIGAALAGLVACTGGPATPTATPPPTQALNPAPSTATPTIIEPTSTVTLPPAAVDIALTLTADAPTPDPTEIARTVRESRALSAAAAETDRAAAQLEVIAATGVRAGRVIDGCGRAVSGQTLVSVLDGESVIEVLVGPEEAQVCGTVNLYDDRPDLFIQRDPIAEGLVQIAMTRAARAAEVEEEEVVLRSARPVNWPDATLGCTAEGAIAPAPDAAFGGVAGYRIAVEAAGGEYVYHTDFDRIIPCVEP